MFENLTYFKKTLELMNIPFYHHSLQLETVENIDNHFRKNFLNSNGYDRFIVILQRFVKPTDLVRITDDFGFTYYLFYYLTDIDSYITIGPILNRTLTEKELTSKFGEFYKQQLVFKNIEHLDYILVSLINTFSERSVQLKVLPKEHLEKNNTLQHKKYQDTIEDYYALENQILLAITNSKPSEAIFLKNLQTTFSFNPRAEDPLEVQKLRFITFNTLCRKAVEQKNIPAFYIDKLSSQIARTIIRAKSINSLENYDHTIIYFYCDLVERYSTIAGYSPAIQKTLFYIEHNFQNELTLSKLADFCHLSKNYLSSLFHKEVKQSLSDYLQEFRINKACEFLSDKRLSISDVADSCGFQSSDYFSKVFKQIKHETPSQYRLKFFNT